MLPRKITFFTFSCPYTYRDKLAEDMKMEASEKINLEKSLQLLQ